MSELIDREDPKVFEAKFNAAMAEVTAGGEAPAREMTPDEEWRNAWNIAEGRIPHLDPEVERAAEGWATYDEMIAPGGIAANLPFHKKRELEAKTHYDFGPRPELKTAAEIAEEQHEIDRANLAQATASLEAFNLAQVQTLGFNSVEDWRAGKEAPQPYLADRGVGEPRAYVLPNSNGQTVDEWIVIAGRPAMNPEFAKITENLERVQRSKRR